MPTKTRLQISIDNNDKENAEQLVKNETGLTLNQYLVMEIKKMSNRYLAEDDELTPEVQRIIDATVSGQNDQLEAINDDADFFKELGID
ncbi:hypothetical protein [Loigolactobacillus coryniformis]|uniref:hypothetical protein n=1 Tax=Loigolactobacillus coryniformis TaxID=1610 RepID=UPI00345CBFE4